MKLWLAINLTTVTFGLLLLFVSDEETVAYRLGARLFAGGGLSVYLHMNVLWWLELVF